MSKTKDSDLIREEEIKQEKTVKVKATLQNIPAPTYWPFLLAVSLLFLGWGLLTYWMIAVAGVIGFFIALTGWIKDILHERGEDE